MKMIYISEENWKKLSHIKAEYMLKSFDKGLSKLFEEIEKLDATILKVL